MGGIEGWSRGVEGMGGGDGWSRGVEERGGGEGWLVVRWDGMNVVER